MSTKLSSGRRVSFSSDQSAAGKSRNRKRPIIVFWVFRLPKSGRFSPEKFLRRLGAKMAKVLRYVSLRKRSTSSNNSSSLKNNGSSKFNRSHSVSDSMEESHRAEAVKDCIKFFNSSNSSSAV
uniref:Josephin-like protein n=1 Tax=Cucumis melo TaxID=3656 RepID=A0A9I9CGL4_CUCME